METLRLNSKLGELTSHLLSSDERENLVFEGRTLVLECAGRAKNAALTKAGKEAADFGSVFPSTNAYHTACAKWSDDLLFYCAKRVNERDGKPTDRNDRRTFTKASFAHNAEYLHTLESVMGDVMYTVTPYLMAEIFGEMSSVISVPRGQTYELPVASNAVIQWEDASWTSLRSVPQDKLYNKSITLNPRPVAARSVINFYQMVASNINMVDTMAAIAGGYAAMLMERFTKAFTLASADTRYVPASLTANGYTGDNWAKICQNVAKSNRVRRNSLIAWGDFLALRKVLPDNATLASSIMMLLGEEYFKNGYIMSHDGVLMYEITPTSTPKTINTTMDSVFPTDTIVIAARANDRYAPMAVGFEDNGEGLIQLTPGDDVLATGRIEVLQYASVDIQPTFASRIGIIKNVT